MFATVANWGSGLRASWETAWAVLRVLPKEGRKLGYFPIFHWQRDVLGVNSRFAAHPECTLKAVSHRSFGKYHQHTVGTHMWKE